MAASTWGFAAPGETPESFAASTTAIEGPEGKVTNLSEEDEQLHFCYDLICHGTTRSQCVRSLCEEFSLTKQSATKVYSSTVTNIRKEQTEQRSELINQLQAIRLVIIQKAIKRGQLMTAVTACKDLGAVIGETLPEQLAVAAPELKISIEAAVANVDTKQSETTIDITPED